MVGGSRKAVTAALLGNLGIAVFKLIAAFVSGSSSMLAEGYHSISDTFNQVLLLIGLRTSRRAPDEGHPFGHGKDQFFWSFVVAVVLFGVAGTFSVREGLHKLNHPEPIQSPGLAYLALLVGVIFEGYALSIALKSLGEEKKREGHRTLLETVRRSKDPTVLTVVFEDSLALIGLAIAGLAITLDRLTGAAVIDAAASILIGLLLMVFALFLAWETKKLLLGESVTPRNRKLIMAAVASFAEVNGVLTLKTMHLGPKEILVAMELDYRDGLSLEELESLNDRIEAEIKGLLPGARVYLEPENRP